MSNKNSTYRSKLYTLLPNQENKITFTDTNPNHVIVQNYDTQSNLYIVGIGVASARYYDEKLQGVGKVLLAQDISFPSISIYVESTQAVQIKIMSFNQEFSPSSINTNNVTISGGGGGGGTSDGIIRGFTASLPVGSNHLGSVNVTSLPALEMQLETLPEGNNKIGKIEVVNQLPLTESNANIGRVTVANELTIRQMPPISISGNIENSYSGYEFFSGDITEETEIIPTQSFARLQFLSNDGSGDLQVKFNQGGYIILKPSEVIGELNIQISSIILNGSTSYRILGVI